MQQVPIRSLNDWYKATKQFAKNYVSGFVSFYELYFFETVTISQLNQLNWHAWLGCRLTRELWMNLIFLTAQPLQLTTKLLR
jgi:hypothetical protein